MKKNSPFVLVNNRSEVEYARKQIVGEVTFICSRRAVFAYCQAEELHSILLHDDMLNGCQPEINSWGYKSTLDALRKLKENSDPPQRVFWESNYCTLKGVLVHALKFILVFDVLVHKYQIKTLYVFQSPRSLFVNTWREYVVHYRSDVQMVEFPETFPPVSANKRFDFLRGLPRRMMSMISNVRSSLMLGFRTGKKCIFVSGALSHLRSVVVSLRKKQLFELVFLESDFNYEKFFFCLKYSIPYMVFPKNKKSWDERLLSNKLALGEGQFVFRGVDYTLLLQKILRIAFETGYMECPFDYNIMGKIFRRLHPAGVLLDEDLSPTRRGLAGLAEQNGLESFVVSHGLPGLPVLEEKHADQFCETRTTFVNSDLEKAAYGNLFFDASQMAVLGTPRYDEMFRVQNSVGDTNVQTKEKTKIVLLCLSVINHYDFDEVYWILAEINSMGDMNRAYIKDLLDVVAERSDVLVKIRPHYDNEQRDVEKYVAGLGSSAKHLVESCHAKIYELEAEADLIVTPESTVIVEAVILKKPVIVMNYGRLDSWSLFKDIRPVIYVRNKNGLRETICRALDDDRFAEDLYAKSGGDISFVNKFTDAKNTERVVSHIVTHIA